MARTSVQLPEDDLATLRRIARKQGVSVSELVRQGVRLLLRRQMRPESTEQWRRARQLAGRFQSGKSDVARRHDTYLDEALER
jgi:Arc/MetJ-type ribon-helix-helix transcriptional regulator